MNLTRMALRKKELMCSAIMLVTLEKTSLSRLLDTVEVVHHLVI